MRLRMTIDWFAFVVPAVAMLVVVASIYSVLDPLGLAAFILTTVLLAVGAWHPAALARSAANRAPGEGRSSAVAA